MKLLLLRNRHFWYICIDFFICTLASFICKYTFEKPWFNVGFLCNDPILSKPYQGDTVTVVVLLSIIWFTTPIFLILCELWTNLKTEQNNILSIMKHSIKTALFNYLKYLVGLQLLTVVTFALKAFGGECRPDFFATCKPDKLATCIQSEYVTDFKCTASTSMEYNSLITQSTSSFPSGHSSSAVFYSVFLTLYIQWRLVKRHNGPISIYPMIQLIIIISSLYVCVSRIKDNRHHWWDVLIGGMLGAYGGFYTANNLCKGFQTPEADTQCFLPVLTIEDITSCT